MKKNDFLKRYCMDKAGTVLIYKVFNNGQPLMQGERKAIDFIKNKDARVKTV